MPLKEGSGPRPRVPLLGRLVRHGFGAGRLEVMATFAMSVLLETSEDADGFSEWLEDRAQTAVPSGLRWVPEHPAGGGRIDVAGVDASGVARVAIEAKFDAQLTADQLRAYVEASPDAVLLVVVAPDGRRAEVESVLQQVPGPPSLALTWSDVADGLVVSGALRAEVDQFAALCAETTQQALPPLRAEDLGEGRADRLADLEAITERVTATLHADLGLPRMYPLQRPRYGFAAAFRYVCVDPNLCFSVGVRAFEFAPETPIWLWWHRDTATRDVVESIASALTAVGRQVERIDGHVWVPMMVQPYLSTDQSIRDLTGQVHMALDQAGVLRNGD